MTAAEQATAPEWRDVSAIRAMLAGRQGFWVRLLLSWLDDSPGGGPATVVSRPSDSLLAVELAARNLFRAICHEHDRGETFPVRVSVCMNALREALGEEYPADELPDGADWRTGQ